MHNSTDSISQYRWLECFNVGGQVIPGFGAVRVVDSDTDGILHVDQPNADSQDVLINGPNPIPPGGVGACTWNHPVFALYDQSSGSPAIDDDWGAANGSYLLKKGNTGFKSDGAESIADGGAYFRRSFGGGGGSGQYQQTQVLTTTGAGSFTTSPKTNYLKCRLIAGGGGGGGAPEGSTNQGGAGGGGSNGGYGEAYMPCDPSTAYNITIGAGGNGGAAGQNVGSDGGDTQMQVGSRFPIVSRGKGGQTTFATPQTTMVAGGVAAASGSDLDYFGHNMPGGWGQIFALGVSVSGVTGLGGFGGSGPFGGGGAPVTSSNGSNGSTNSGGGGGGGHAIHGTGDKSGGNGGSGVIIVDEYS